ncbi:MAG: polysaccharide biosynthesis protein [Lachnospiraceae bacterium]
MKRTSPLILGTLILTATGLLSRMIGFFYRIFLSRTFGEEGMGIYQLIAPVLALSFSLSASGIQTAISKYVASEPSTHNRRYSFWVVLCGSLLSVTISLILAGFVFIYSTPIASRILLEHRCAPLLRIVALSFPFSSLHACINGYFYGIKKTSMPAFTQVAEQIARVGSVYLIFIYAVGQGYSVTISFAVIGSIIGEIISMLISMIAIYFHFYQYKSELKMPSIQHVIGVNSSLIKLAAPLSANRVVINLLQSIEAIYIPRNLILFGATSSDALRLYGVLMGMALPLILFPSALTNSASVLLLPLVSEAESNRNDALIQKAVLKSIRYCLILGFFCMFVFLLCGKTAGLLLFHSQIAGSYIMTLSFICPFLYIVSTLTSILNGLGRTITTFIIQILALLIRLLFVYQAIPRIGMKGYLWGLLLSQLFLTGCCIFSLRRYLFLPCTSFQDRL